ncbi:DNA-directed RNA polymerase II subunit RPB9 [Chaetoceros tenuissimus]|uniref:DNA-directed RNA polymerase II subunit RPB9 n=1 Tax=Chaetoceros tenuissimus TaxID=426638 RepID=A0AAD3CVR4_9STRA|nr:DNA-directed RNA polymerase II subunit RPB9 [Chaetoceros tenuissimus]
MDIEDDWNQEYEGDANQEYDAELDLDSHQAPTTAPDGALLMRFCPHDSSMLYPKEHKGSRTLHYACRLCQYSEKSNNPMIYRNVIKKEAKNVLHTVPGAIIDDPTLPRSQNAVCENCGHNEAVFFQSDTGQSDSLALIFVCTNCEHKKVK